MVTDGRQKSCATVRRGLAETGRVSPVSLTQVEFPSKSRETLVTNGGR